MKKLLFYGMTGEKMCFLHILMNALALFEAGHDAKIIFEGASVKLVSVLEEESNPLYQKAKSLGLIAGVCLACSKVLGVFEKNAAYALPMLDDMNNHAGMKPYIEAGYEIISM